MINFKNAVAELLDEGISLEEIIALARGYKVEYDNVHITDLVDRIEELFHEKGCGIDRNIVEEFVKSNYSGVSCTEEKCNCANTDSKTMKVAEKTLPQGKIKVMTNTGNPDEILDSWMRDLGLRD